MLLRTAVQCVSRGLDATTSVPSLADVFLNDLDRQIVRNNENDSSNRYSVRESYYCERKSIGRGRVVDRRDRKFTDLSSTKNNNRIIKKNKSHPLSLS